MQATVLSCVETADGSGIFWLKLFLPKPMKAKAGQFITLKPRTIMRRPFLICLISSNGKEISVRIKVVGKNTRTYSKLQPENRIDIAGPKGNPIPFNPAVKKYMLVGGGTGIAGVGFKATELRELDKTVKVFLGTRDSSQIFGVGELESIGCMVQVITQEGPGTTGMVTDLLREALVKDQSKSTIIACGPVLMLKKIADMAARSGNKCLVLLEEIMACGGVGSCKGCAVFFKDGTVKNVCTDGPAFDASLIDWERLMRRYEAAPSLITSRKRVKNPLEVTLTSPDGQRKITFPYPIVPNSGCVGIEALEDGSVSIKNAGAVITKGVRIKPRLGNPLPRVAEVPGGMLNSIGLAGPGLEKFIIEYLSRWKNLGLPVIVNIGGETINEFATIADELADGGVAAYEINISCPNVKDGCAFGMNANLAYEVISAVRETVPNIFLIVKLTPAAGNQGIVEVARAVVNAGADALSLINTVPGLAFDIYSRKAKLGAGSGGLSGPAIRTLANRMIHDVYEANLGVGIIGYGGVNDGESAMEKILCGADIVGVGTALFKKGGTMSDIYHFLPTMVEYHGVSCIGDLVGQGVMQGG